MKADKPISVILFIFSVFMFVQATFLPKPVFGTLGAGFFPKILFVLLGIFSCQLFIKSMIDEKNSLTEIISETKNRPFNEQVIQTLKHHHFVIIGFLAFFVYLLLLYYVGYIFATLVFMPFLMWYTGPGNRKSVVIIGLMTLGVTFIIYFSFLKLLQVFLPSGVLF